MGFKLTEFVGSFVVVGEEQEVGRHRLIHLFQDEVGCSSCLFCVVGLSGAGRGRDPCVCDAPSGCDLQ